MSLLKWMYLLDKDNYIIENKVFIDLMWYIARNKDNGPYEPKGMVTVTKGEKRSGREVLNVKSYVIRNAGVMFQQIFYWHMNYIKKNASTPYQYKGKNVIKMDFEDWWECNRLTDTEVSTANKFLTDTGLVNIHKMRIKHRDEAKGIDVFKPSNCYSLNSSVLELYLEKLIDISKELYREKVDEVRKKNVESSIKSRSKELSTENLVTLETGVTLETYGLEGIEGNILTISTESTDDINPVTLETRVTKVTFETGVTKDTLETGVTKDTLETGVTNKSNTSSNTSTDTLTEKKDTSPLSILPDKWDDIKNIIRGEMSEVSFNTWISTVNCVKTEDLTAIFEVDNNFTKEILEARYNELICKAIRAVVGKPVEAKYIVRG